MIITNKQTLEKLKQEHDIFRRREIVSMEKKIHLRIRKKENGNLVSLTQKHT